MASLSKNDIIKQYVIIVGAVIGVTILRIPIEKVLGVPVRFMMYLPVILVAAWVAGRVGGVVAIVLSAIAAITVERDNPKLPILSLPSDQYTLAIFILVGLGISAIGHAQRVARQAAEAASREASARELELRRSEERYRRLLHDASEGLLEVSADDVITFANPSFSELIGYEPEELVGKPIYFIYFEDDYDLVQARREARRAGIGERYETRLRRKDGHAVWTLSNVTLMTEDGEYRGTFTMFTDITARKQAEMELADAYKREVILNRIGEAIRQSVDIDEVQNIAIEALGSALEADRCITVVVDKERDALKFVHERHAQHLTSIVGEYRISDLFINFDQAFPEGQTQVVNDLAATPHPATKPDAAGCMGLRSVIAAPLLAEKTVTAILAVFMTDDARSWSADEVSLVEAVASQVRSAMEASRLLAESEARAERAALLNRIGQALRASVDPEVIQHRVAELLGKSLRVDRCFYITYDEARDFIYAATDWHRPDLHSLAGEYSLSATQPDVREFFRGGTAVIRDWHAAGIDSADQPRYFYPQRATLAVPLYDGDELVAALFAVMVDMPREWTSDEIAVAEQVAVLTRTSVEAARTNLREHHIATRLQDALQPAIPARVPGLRLAHYYRPGSEEAEVGGDFADCFSTEKGLTYLMVGDLSGKGLEAAAQVAVVRNMLRYAIFNEDDLARSINTLNRTLAETGMISGFATLFCACYDGVSRTLRYVNCGQEPALIRRAAGGVDALPATGTVLGTIPDTTYGEGRVSLSPGDCVVIFTDGLTEAGPVRSALMGIEGVTEILSAMTHTDEPDQVVDELVDGVDLFAETGVRDDVCLLVAIATG